MNVSVWNCSNTLLTSTPSHFDIVLRSNQCIIYSNIYHHDVFLYYPYVISSYLVSKAVKGLTNNEIESIVNPLTHISLLNDKKQVFSEPNAPLTLNLRFPFFILKFWLLFLVKTIRKVQGDYCQMQKSIKLLIQDASLS